MENSAAKSSKAGAVSSKYEITVENAFKKYSDMIFRLAFVRTGSVADAEDLLSEVFIRLVKNIHKIKTEQHLKAWLVRVTVNCSNSFAACLAKNRHDTLENIPQVSDEEEIRVLPFVLDLPNNFKTVIYLYYYEGYSTKEIARLLRIAEGTVKSRLSRARKTLKNLIEGETFYV